MRRRTGRAPGRRRIDSLSWDAVSVYFQGEEKRDLPHQSLINEVRSKENFESAFGIFKESPYCSFFFGLQDTLCFRGIDERIRIAVSPGLIRDWDVSRHFLLVIVVIVIRFVLDPLVERGERAG